MKIGEEPKGTAPHFEGRLSTADELAAQHATAVDKLGLGKEVTAGQVEASRKEIIKAATALPENPTPIGEFSKLSACAHARASHCLCPRVCPLLW